MKQIFTFFALLFSVSILSAQFPGGGGGFGKTTSIKGKIEGILIDSVTKEVVSFATVALKKQGASLAVDGVVTDEKGFFKFSDVLSGKYDLVFSFIGYNEKIVKVETTLKKPDLNIGQQTLAPASVLLDAVEVKAERALIENKVDRLVFNAENDASISGGDATDVLRKVPLLSVDLNGNVSLRGSQNVRILINGKPSGMFSNNVADALKMFPADQIKKVEVITAPSAKYDGEGSAGIINIITGKTNLEGLAGSINTSVGNLQNNAVLSLNAGRGRFGLNSSGSVFYSIPADGTLSFSRISDDGKSKYLQSGTTTTSRLGVNGNANLFYDINGYNSINSTFNVRGFGFNTDGVTNGEILFNGLTDKFSRDSDGGTLFGGFDWNTDYTRKFENQEGKEFSIAAQLSKDNNDQESTILESYSSTSLLNRDVRIFNDGDNTEYTLQTDFTQPFKKGANKLEMGAKTVLRNIVSDFFNEKKVDGSYQKIPSTTNIYEYDQNVYAGYFSYSFIINKKNNFIIGGRYERTDIQGQNRIGVSDTVTNGYNSFLPSLTYSRNLPKFRSVKISYTQRIQRPTLFFINPFNNNQDQFNVTRGNPELEPELVHQTDLSYNATIKGFTTFSSLYYKRTSGIIESVLKQDNTGASITTFANVGTNNAIGLNTFVSKSVGKITLRTGGNIFSYQAKGIVNNEPLERASYEYNIFVNGDYSLTGTWKADLFGFFKSPVRTLQGDNPAFSIYGIGVRKDWKNSSLGIRLIEPHTANKHFTSNIKTGEFTQTSDFAIPFRSVGVNFRYKFGKVDFKERTSRIKNTDAKSGDGGGQQGGATTPARQ